jgi:hypothetical protein
MGWTGRVGPDDGGCWLPHLLTLQTPKKEEREGANNWPIGRAGQKEKSKR